MNDIEREVRRIERGQAWQDTDEVVEIEVTRPLDKVIAVRLPAEHWDELDRQARALGVNPAALLQRWVLEKLRAVPTP